MRAVAAIIISSKSIVSPAHEFKQSHLRLKTEDLDGDGKPETFYEIDGVRYFSHIDGEKIVP